MWLWDKLAAACAIPGLCPASSRVEHVLLPASGGPVREALARHGLTLIPGLAPKPSFLAADAALAPLTEADFAAYSPGQPNWCVEAGDTFSWSADGGSIKLNGNILHIKGLNWFGYETFLELPQGLHVWGLDQAFAFLAQHRFNAIRLPFSLEWALGDWDAPPEHQYNLPPDLRGLSTADVFHRLLDAAARHGVLVLLDLHVLSPQRGLEGLWYDGVNTEERVLQGWEKVLGAACKHWNVFGVDLKNEPHGEATWGHGSLRTDFHAFAERAIKRLAASVPGYTGLWFVEGTEENDWTDKFAHWWGGNLDGVKKRPVRTGDAAIDRRVVLSPHIYGPEVYEHSYFDSRHFPGILDDVWDSQYGWVEAKTGQAMVVGEWGGSLAGDGKASTTQRKLGEWLVRNCAADNFWWCLNPATSHNGGLLGVDYNSADQNVLRLLHWMQPRPTRFIMQGPAGQVCVRDGAFANPRCAIRNGLPLNATMEAIEDAVSVKA